MKDIPTVLNELKKSNFRNKQQLCEKDLQYLHENGLDAVIEHGKKIITQRLAPAFPRKDGKQTPWRGHPVFTAQHGTATCCRTCLHKWHNIERGKPLTEEEQTYVLNVLRAWLEARNKPVQ